MSKKISDIHYQTFKRGSKTYFNSSLFFPKAVRRDVFLLYGFVRVADDFVDSVPADEEAFWSFEARYRKALAGEAAADPIIDGFVELMMRKRLDPGWIAAFFHSMEMDLHKKTYERLEETLEYIYGSAEVIGLCMARIMDLTEGSHLPAAMLGRSMQYINFIRDIDEDLGLGRRYLPLTGGLPSLDRESAEKHPKLFEGFVHHHLKHYREWQQEAEKGFHFIPRRYRIPIKTASDMYNWTARRIAARPAVVFQRKVKPGKSRIILQVLNNVFTA